MTGLDLSRAVWRKSSRSQLQASECVEVAAAWRKSTHSGSGEGECVEVARAARLVAVRDSKNPGGPVLAFTPAQWHTLLTSIKTNALA